MTAFAPLPIDAATPDLIAALTRSTTAVLVAPPGAGKTTRVPLVLAAEPWAAGKKILVLEPRRLAARAAAARMAKTLGEKVGDTVGYRVRFGTMVSKRTRVEVITEGIFTGLIQDDPSLDGVGAVLFDEFHERSLDADLGLALARDAQQALREDLRLLVMSATIDGARIAAALGDAPVIASEGRAFAVETRYLGRNPVKPIEPQVADAVLRALRAETGSILAFLPGAAEIRRCETMVRERCADPAVDVFALHGTLDFDAQDRAIAPAQWRGPGRQSRACREVRTRRRQGRHSAPAPWFRNGGFRQRPGEMPESTLFRPAAPAARHPRPAARSALRDRGRDSAFRPRTPGARSRSPAHRPGPRRYARHRSWPTSPAAANPRAGPAGRRAQAPSRDRHREIARGTHRTARRQP